MPEFFVDTTAVTHASDQFAHAASRLETVLSQVTSTGIGEPVAGFCSVSQPGISVFGSFEALSDYLEASNAIAESIVQLVTSLKCMDEKLLYASEAYISLQNSLTIR